MPFKSKSLDLANAFISKCCMWALGDSSVGGIIHINHFLKKLLLFKYFVGKHMGSSIKYQKHMSHLSYCCDNLFKKLNLQFNWNKKEFYLKIFFPCFAVDRSSCIQYKLKICCEWLSLSLGSYGRNSWGAMHPVRDSQSRQAPTSLCLDEGNPDHYWNVGKLSWCSRGSWDVCCKLLSLHSCVCCAHHCLTAGIQLRS